MRNVPKTIAIAAIGGLSISVARTAWCDETPESTDSGLQEIVVTAQRRTENVQDVGISVAVLTADDLRSKGVTSSTELAELVPGVHMSGSLAGESQQFSIRGVTQNDFNDSIEAPVAVYVDDAYVPDQQGQTLSIFDVQRVEILKGPQGTLFGRNATGGLVQFVVKQPTDVEEGYADVSYGRFGQTTFEGALSGPLAEGVSGRVAVFYDRLENYWTNDATPKDSTNFGGTLDPCCSNEGGHKTYAGRMQLKIEPSDALDIRLVGSAAKRTLSTAPYTSEVTIPGVDANGTVINTVNTGPSDTRTIIGPGGANYYNPTLFPLQGAQTALGFGPAAGYRYPGATWYGYTPSGAQDLSLSSVFAQPNSNQDSTESGAVHVHYTTGGLDIVSITNAMAFAKSYLMSADGGPVNLFQYGSDSRGNDLSQEFRLSGGSPAVHWVTGLYYLHINNHTIDGLLGAPGSLFAGLFDASATGADPVGDRELITNSTSLFGQVDYKFAPQWTLVVGARGINERQRYNLRYYVTEATNPYAINTSNALFDGPYAPFSNSRTQNLWAGKAQLEYRPTDGLLTYLGVNRGVKAGSYNAKIYDGTPDITPQEIPYKPEELLSTEGGVKWNDPQHRYQLDVSVFHYDYKNYQAFVFTSLTGYVQNFNARTNGAEFQGTLMLTGSLALTVGYAYLDALIPNYQYAPGYFKDVTPSFSSKNQADAVLSYTVPGRLWAGQVRLSTDVSYTSSFFDNLHNFSSENLPGHTLENANISWTEETSGNKPSWYASAYIKNIADKRYPIIGFDSSADCGCTVEGFGMPRMFGLTVGASF